MDENVFADYQRRLDEFHKQSQCGRLNSTVMC